MVGFEEGSGGELAYFLLSQLTSTYLLKTDQWSLFKEVEVKSFTFLLRDFSFTYFFPKR